MGRISVEIVPRDEKSFQEELTLVNNLFPSVDTINIPDILKFDMRIPEACEVAKPYFSKVIPHIRAVAFHKDTSFEYKDLFEKVGIKEVLVILGDNPEIVSKSENPCDSIDLIKKIKREMPKVKVYAGIDQWRNSFEEELDYINRKIDAGCEGFFTQPFYDIGLIEQYGSKLKDIDIFWGLAPVIRESSKHYWETKNNVKFPDNFQCTMEWNKIFAKEVLKYTKEDKFNVYLCPITVDIESYLTGLV